MSVLEVKDLTVKYHNKALVKNVSFELGAGEVLAIVGESGSGKSLIAKSIVRLNDERAFTYPKKSQINFLEQNILALNEDELQNVRGRSVGLIFQDPFISLNPVHDIKKQIAELLLNHKLASKKEAYIKVEDILKEVGLAEISKRRGKIYPHELSGGQRQRVMIALSLIANPQIVIADEPTTALDPETEDEIIDLLVKLKNKFKMSLIFITHDLGVVEKIADKILVLKTGEVVEHGSAKQVMSKPKHKYTKELLFARELKFTLGKKTRKFPTVTVKNLTISYEEGGFFKKKNNIVLNKVGFSVFPGETVGLIGASGSGKSSIAKSVLKLQAATGDISLNNTFLSNLNAKQLRKTRRDMQIIFQDPFATLNPKMTIYQTLKEGLVAHNIENYDDIIKKVILEVGLGREHLERYPSQFSGGQRQRIAIARAISLTPKFIILDEPTASLDVTSQKEILELLLGLQEKYQLAYLFISHDLKLVKAISHRVLKIENKRLKLVS